MSSTGVNSALASVNARGQLACRLCNAAVKSAAVWTAHVNGKQHRANAAALKRKAGRHDEKATETAAKRPAADGGGVTKPAAAESALPADFFDGGGAKPMASSPPADRLPDVEMAAATAGDDTTTARQRAASPTPADKPSDLPEGFFDDSSTDRKMRGVPDVEPAEEEWQRWQKELKSVEAKADVVEEEEEQRRDTQRSIEQVDEQIERWAKVNTMQDQFEQLAKATPVDGENTADDKIADADLDDIDLEAALDWRVKTLK